MNLLKKIILVFFIFSIVSFSQIKPGAKQIALSHSSVAAGTDAYDIYNNPALLAKTKRREAGIYYSPSPFGINKLANGAAVFYEPTDYGGFAFAYSFYGFELYKKNSILLSYSNKIFETISLGATIVYQNLSIKNYGNDYAFTLIAGGVMQISENFNAGFSIDNLTHSTFGAYDNQLPIIFDFGLSYTILKILRFNAAIEKELEKNTSLHIGIDYKIIKYLNLRIGVMNEPASFSAGIGINYSIIQLDYALFNHQDLGFTHQLGLNIIF
jgi:hypothetical protein